MAAMDGTSLPTPQISLWHRLQKKIFLLRHPWIDYIEYVALFGGLLIALSISTKSLGYRWQWYKIPDYLYEMDAGKFVAGPLLTGLAFTLRVSGASLVMSMVLGLIIALMRLSDSFAAKLISRIYLEIVRNVPVLVLLYITYFAIGPLFGLTPEPSAMLALTLFSASYLSEIFRAGIVSITKGQWEAAHSLGLSMVDTYKDIILPQAFRRIIPPLTGQAITLIKSSALFSVVGLHDLSLETQVIAARTFMVFEAWFVAAALYLAINIPLSTLTNWMEKKFDILT